MTLAARIQQFIGRALTKQRAIATSLIKSFDRDGYVSDDAKEQLLQSYEIKNFIILLSKPGYGGLTIKQVGDIIDFFYEWLELKKVSFVNYTNYQSIIDSTTVNVATGVYALQADLVVEISQRQAGDASLDYRVTVLEANQLDPSTFFPAGFFDNLNADNAVVFNDDTRLHTHANKATLDQFSPTLLTLLQALQAHYNSIGNPNGIHVSSGDRAAWNAKISSSDLTTILAGYSQIGHHHVLGDVDGLVDTLDAMNADIAAMAGQDGREVELQSDGDLIQWRYVGDPTWIDLGNFKGDKGDDGDPFTIDARGTSINRFNAIYNGEDEHFTYLEEDTGYLYFRNPSGGAATTPTGWNNGLQFLGNDGWSPLFGSIEISSSRVVQFLADWVGGEGPKPVLDPGTNPPNPIVWYIGPSGLTLYQAQATNIKGPIGPSRTPKVDVIGAITDRPTYDTQPEGFTFMRNDVSPQTVFIKNSDASGDWGPELPWQGPPGSGSGGSSSGNIDGGVPSSVYLITQNINGGTP